MAVLALMVGVGIGVDVRITMVLIVLTLIIVLASWACLKPYSLILFMLLIGTIRFDSLLGRDIRFFSDSSGPVGGASLDGLRLISLVLVFIATVVTAPKYRRQMLSMPMPLFVFCSYALVSLLWTQWPIEGLRLIFKMLYPLLVMWIIMGSVRSLSQAHQIGNVILAALGLNIGLGIISITLGIGASPYDNPARGWVRQGTILLPPAPLALFLALSVFLALTYYLKSWRMFYLVLAGTGLLQLFFTLERMAWFMFLAGLMVYASMNVNKRSILFIFIIALFTLLAPVLIPQFGSRFTYGLDFQTWLSWLVTDPVSALGILNTSGRSEIYYVIIDELIAVNPVFGSGMGTFQLASYQLISLADGDGWRLLVDVGIIGFVLYMAFVVCLIRRILRTRGSLDVEGKWISTVAIGALVQYSLSFVADNPLDYYNLLSQYVFALVALALVWPRLTSNHNARTAHQLGKQDYSKPSAHS
jgi:hypothetical protein